MLVLTRKPNETIVIANAIRITVVAVKGDRVRLGIEAPGDVPVDRAEVHARRMQFVEVPVGVCDETVDLGGIPSATAADTHH